MTHCDSPALHMLPAAARTALPWKNGGGKTWDVAVFPPGSGMDTFAWRISMAEVAVEGPFSSFENVDRILVVLEGRLELRYTDEGRSVYLEPGQSHAFPGDVAISGRPLDGAVRDLNIMVRRGAWRARVSTGRPKHLSDTTVLAVSTRPSSGFAIYDAAVLGEEASLPPDFSGYFIGLRPA